MSDLDLDLIFVLGIAVASGVTFVRWVNAKPREADRVFSFVLLCVVGAFLAVAVFAVLSMFL